MNSISLIIWLIAFSETLRSFSSFWVGAAGFVFCVAFIVRFMANFFMGVSSGSTHSHETSVTGWKTHTEPVLDKIMKGVGAALVILILINAIVPKREYLVMIAASEIGERVLQTETAQNIGKSVSGISSEATELLRSYIEVETFEMKDKLGDLQREQQKKIRKRAIDDEPATK